MSYSFSAKVKIPVLSVFLLTALAFVSAAESAENSQLKVVHLSPNAEPMDIYIEDELVAEDVGFGESVNVEIEPGEYRISAVASGGDVEDAEISRTVTLEDDAYSFVITNRAINLDAELLRRETSTAENSARIRIAHFSPDLVDLEAELENGDSFGTQLSYRQTSEYRTFEPGNHTLEVTETRVAGTSFEREFRLRPGRTYTAFIAGSPGGANPRPQIILVADSPVREENGENNGHNGDEDTENGDAIEKDFRIQCEIVPVS